MEIFAMVLSRSSAAELCCSKAYFTALSAIKIGTILSRWPVWRKTRWNTWKAFVVLVRIVWWCDMLMSSRPDSSFSFILHFLGNWFDRYRESWKRSLSDRTFSEQLNQQKTCRGVRNGQYFYCRKTGWKVFFIVRPNTSRIDKIELLR